TIKTIDAFCDFAVFPGAEVYLRRALEHGAQGCISATANVNARGIVELIAKHDTPEGPRLQEQLNAVRTAVQSKGPVPAIKAVLAARYGDDEWRNVRPPLMALAEGPRASLLEEDAIA